MDQHLRQNHGSWGTKKNCNVGSWTNNKGEKEICWKRGDGCSAGGSIMNNQFLVILINLYSY